MNKKIIITMSVVVCVFVLGIGIYHSDASQADPALSVEDVKEMVKAQYPGEDANVELKKDNNRIVYEVDVNHNDRQYEIVIDGDNGEILKLKEKEASKEQLQLDENEQPSADDQSDGDNNQQDETDEPDKDESSNEPSNNANDDSTKETSETGNKTGIDAKQAIDIALNEFPGTIVELELESDDGRLIYEIEIESAHEEAEIEIDAHTGEILVIDID